MRASRQATARTQRPSSSSSAEAFERSSAADPEGERAGLVAAGDVLSDGDVKLAIAPWRRPFLVAANAQWLNWGSTTLVVLNMAIMCMPYDGMSDEYAAQLETVATIITWIFILEMGVKLLGFGCEGYWSDSWNCLDGTIVSLSILEMVVTALLAQLDGLNISFFRILRMLRMLRVLRILRLMKSWAGLYKIVTTFIRAIPHMSNLAFLIVLAMFMFALLGMQVFGGIYTPENGYSLQECPGGVCPDGLQEKPHYHFDYCVPAMITVFILLTGAHACAVAPAVAFVPTDTLRYVHDGR